MRNIALITITILGVSACGSRTKTTERTLESQKEIARLDSLVQVLQQKNAAQEEWIKELEDELESVVTFLGNEMGY